MSHLASGASHLASGASQLASRSEAIVPVLRRLSSRPPDAIVPSSGGRLLA
ncbi:MAG: hypothetical protein JJE40_13060 [Vicinamibacteria bacterium]|nr:hypothetical protein [Vicinamibacteria bacterium]